MTISLPQSSHFHSNATLGLEALLVKVTENVRDVVSQERESRELLAECACPCFELQPAPSSHLLFFWFQIDNLKAPYLFTSIKQCIPCGHGSRH